MATAPSAPRETMTPKRLFPSIPRIYVSGALRIGGLALVAGPLALTGPGPWAGMEAAWAATATLDRPTFDRKATTINVPFKGRVPNHTVQYLNGATRLNVDFLGAAPKVATPYKLAVYHELLSQVELIPEGDKVRLSILTAKAAKVSVDVDLRHGQLRLMLEEIDTLDAEKLTAGTPTVDKAAPPTAAPFVVQNGPPPKNLPTGNAPAMPAQAPVAAPRATPGPLPPNGLDPLSPSPPPIAPNILPPSAPPIMTAAQKAAGGYVEPGSPASGQYIYRKAVPTGNQDVTEVQVRTGTKAEVGVAHDPRAQSVVVNVVRPDAPERAPAEDVAWTRSDGPAPSSTWRMPSGPRRDLTFRPMPALDAVVGYAAVLNESAPALGSEFAGQGATTWGFDGHVPLGTAFNFSLGMEGLAYGITSPQVKDDAGKDAQTRREEFIGRAQLEYLAVRSPWVFAIGPGYWGRYLMNRPGSLLPPPAPSLVVGPNQLFHGPALQTRIYVPIWDTFGVAAEAGAAPYMMGGADSVATTLGSLYGYQGALAVKWGTRNLSVSAGYRHQGFGNFGGSYSYGRGGPEASFVWRF